MTDVPRRSQMQCWVPAERAIYDAVQKVEEMAADERLTRAVILLQEARALVADFVEGVLSPAGAETRIEGWAYVDDDPDCSCRDSRAWTFQARCPHDGQTRAPDVLILRAAPHTEETP